MKDIKLANGTTVQMREPKVRDMRIASTDTASPADQEVKLIGNLTSLSPDEIDELSLKDYATLQKALKGFL